MAVKNPPRIGLAELEQAVECRIGHFTTGRLHRLRVEATRDRVIVHGYTSSYYIKQLALQATLEVTRGNDAPQIELDIVVL